ncbi:hypothetical protein ZWY2020_033524 [Hordeum vulgare]|nr:hypothetical protein ZWY2020_033524 [Hordeum vulgare]
MQMDDLPWPRNPRPQRADGIAMVAGWASACEVRCTVTQSPALRPFCIIRPWPGLRGAHGTRRPRRPPEKAHGKGPRSSRSRAGGSKLQGAHRGPDRSQTAIGAGPGTDSNPLSPDAVVEGIGTPLRAAPTPSAQPDQPLYVGPLSLDSEIPDSQAAQHPTPGEADPHTDDETLLLQAKLVQLLHVNPAPMAGTQLVHPAKHFACITPPLIAGPL